MCTRGSSQAAVELIIWLINEPALDSHFAGQLIQLAWLLPCAHLRSNQKLNGLRMVFRISAASASDPDRATCAASAALAFHAWRLLRPRMKARCMIITFVCRGNELGVQNGPSEVCLAQGSGQGSNTEDNNWMKTVAEPLRSVGRRSF
tara:strand:+ start:467 stop:910 length:444 start_codon:yes stop_codon:yes gene_type:complete